MLECFGSPAIFALIEVGLGAAQHGCLPAHVLDVLLRGDLGRKVVEIGRIAVIPAHVALVHGAGVVAQRAVVATVRPELVEFGRQLDELRDFLPGVALVHQVDRLVVRVLVEVALLLPVIDDLGVAPHRPVVGLELEIDILTVEVDGLVQVAGPLQCVAYLRAAQCQDVVHRVGRVLGHPHALELREERVHFRRRLGARRHLEHHLDAIHRDFGAGLADDVRGYDQPRFARRHGLPQPAVHAAASIAGQ
ncbi:hypothetical protein D3C72_1272490 [compost metagenome]